MTTEQERTDASSRERSPDHEFTLSLEQVADRYAQAGLPRTLRAIQKYCAVGKLDARKAEIETGEQWLVASYSVERHIAYIKEVRTAAAGRGLSRTDAAVRPLENKDEPPAIQVANSPEQPRQAASVRGPDDRYVEQLEKDNEFLRDQIGVKDGQIKELTERAREINFLIAGLQKMLTPPVGRAEGEESRPN